MHRLISSIFILSILIMISCGDDQTVKVYHLLKVNPEKSYGHEWLPLNTTEYKVGEDKVVGLVAGMLSEYDKCIIQSVKNWQCTYSDGSGTFGIRNGEYWEDPQLENMKIVSSFEYNIVRCKWDINDEHSGYLWGIARCILGWE